MSCLNRNYENICIVRSLWMKNEVKCNPEGCQLKDEIKSKSYEYNPLEEIETVIKRVNRLIKNYKDINLSEQEINFIKSVSFRDPLTLSQKQINWLCMINKRL